jgi:hypothetical protein
VQELTVLDIHTIMTERDANQFSIQDRGVFLAGLLHRSESEGVNRPATSIGFIPNSIQGYCPCESLSSITFESDSHLTCIESESFFFFFSYCQTLSSITFQSNSDSNHNTMTQEFQQRLESRMLEGIEMKMGMTEVGSIANLLQM